MDAHGITFSIENRPKTSAVFDTYWRFAFERQNIFFRRINGELKPWTDDPILRTYKFTNAYRASDRVSQYLIKNIIYAGSQDANELFFRIILFKAFNRISTWEFLVESLGQITWKEFDFNQYNALLSESLENGGKIFSSAYIMPSLSNFGFHKKHSNLLRLIELMLQDGVAHRIREAASMKEAYEILLSYPGIGQFLAMQYVIDINYSNLTSFSEMDFIIPGPGARDGIAKCFTDIGSYSEIDIIKWVTERQEEEFARLGLDFKSLWGRPLQLIDCQNLFCEVDKYARIAHPEVAGRTGRVRIKQLFTEAGPQISYTYPPKWNLYTNCYHGEMNARI